MGVVVVCGVGVGVGVVVVCGVLGVIGVLSEG